MFTAITTVCPAIRWTCACARISPRNSRVSLILWSCFGCMYRTFIASLLLNIYLHMCTQNNNRDKEVNMSSNLYDTHHNWLGLLGFEFAELANKKQTCCWTCFVVRCDDVDTIMHRGCKSAEASLGFCFVLGFFCLLSVSFYLQESNQVWDWSDMKVEVIELQIRVSCVGPHGLEYLYLSAAELAKQIQVPNAHL